MSGNYAPAVVLCISGNDPTGGAGIAADIETIASIGCQPAPVISSLTVQNSHNVQALKPVEPQLLIDQAEAIFNDFTVSCIKTGLLGSVENIKALSILIKQHPKIPLVVDPILRAGGGKNLSSQKMINAFLELIFPYTTVLTPNSEEARALTNEQELNHAANRLLSTGCKSVLITGAHETEPNVINRFYQAGHVDESYAWERLGFSYHGSGCTLAAATAAFIAQGLTTHKAIIEAQQFAWESLKHGFRLGQGQHQPNRLFWAQIR